MPEKLQPAVDNKKTFGALLADLSKAFDLLSHELLLLLARFSAQRLVYSYLKNRKLRTKINSTYSSWEEILFGVPHGSILGLCLLACFYVIYFT